MSDNPKGLRFDIYERLTLPDEVPGIGELQDVELVPRITMQTQHDQAVLSGDLLLMGTYVGIDERNEPIGIKQLNHRIPVEITVPLKRIRRMDGIGIEIEDFDVDLLSSRTLNLTGVISLNGVDTSAEQTWQQQGDAVFVHEAALQADQSKQPKVRPETFAVQASSAYAADSTDSGAASAAADGPAFEERQEDERPSAEPAAESSAVMQPAQRLASQPDFGQDASGGEAYGEPQRVEPQPVSGNQSAAGQTAKSEEKAEKVSSEASQKQAPAGETQEMKPNVKADEAPSSQTASAAEKSAAAQVHENAAHAGVAETAHSAAEGSKEMKIAFGSLKQESDQWTGGAAGVKALLGKQSDKTQEKESAQENVHSAKEHAPKRDAEEPLAQESADTDTDRSDDKIQWKHLFLSSENEERRFKKMRMCIVQKEETLETIAARYSLNPKEIVLYNRLNSEQVHEGQVIYIPVNA